MRPITVTVDSCLRLSLDDLPEQVATRLRAMCSHNNPQHARLKSMGFRFNREAPIIRTWDERDGQLILPRGVNAKLRDELKRAGLRPRYDDRRVTAGVCRMPRHRRTLWQHQAEAVDAIIAKQNCLIRAPTGSGKTTAAIGAALRIGHPTLVIVWNGALLKQWHVRLIDELGIDASDVGIVKGAKRRIRPFTLAMQQTLWANDERLRALAGEFGCVICDEVQRFAARTFLGVIHAFPAKYRVGISADETRKDGKHFLIYDAFGEVVHEVAQAKLIGQGVVHDVEIRVIPTDFRADWYVEQKQTDGQLPDFNRFLDEATHDAARNDLLTKIMVDEANAGQRIVALTHRREHAQIISARAAAAAFDCGLMLGSDESAAELVESTEGLLTGTMMMAAGTYQAIGQGIDLPVVDRGICATPLGTNRQLFGQVRGRFCRTAEGKDDAILFYLWDRHVFGLNHLVNLKRWNRNVKVKTANGWIEARRFIMEAKRGN